MRASWLIPVRDGAAWLREAVDSALAQCSTTDEVVVVDDGSTDGGALALREHARLKVVRQEALGITAALERGRSVCQGRYLARLDADDIALPHRLEAQIKVLDSEPDLAVVGGRAQLISEEPGAEGMRHYVDWVNRLENPHSQLLVESPLFHPAATLRAEAIAAVGGYREGDFPEDYDLWLRLVSAGWRLSNLPQEVVRIRDRRDRLTRQDPRYRPEAFRRLRMAHLARTDLATPKRVVVWGAGRGGRPWIRWLLEQGHHLPAVLDIKWGTERQGVPILSPDALGELEFDLLLVAVGLREVKEEIRDHLAQIWPEGLEGQDWWAVL